ncbi:UNVERIFIED_CONTAM: hypothetical protein PYX00_009411 [Menopon gallinae]|uniref:FAD-dependent oxidoreductase domain-containing protein 1 n=1 Tax=Menopon gallinae TaxID=328185 RepID=A0AAW2HAY9_9NEOP
MAGSLLRRLQTSYCTHIKKGLTRTFTRSSCIGEKKEDNAVTVSEKETIPDESGKKLVLDEDKKDEVFYGGEFSGISSWDPKDIFEEKPMDRIARVHNYDMVRVKEKVMTRLGFEFEPQLHKYYNGPTWADVVIIGGGAIGSACAYWIKKKASEGVRVVVLDRDMSYKSAAINLSVDGLRQQYSLPEHVEMSLYGYEFIRQAEEVLSVENLPAPEVCYEPCGYLRLATDEGAESLMQSSEMQNALGCTNVLLNRKRLRQRFPWLNADNFTLGCLGTEKEGWFNPWALLLGFKTKAQSLGVEYFNSEVVGFQFGTPHLTVFDHNFRFVKALIMRHPSGMCTKMTFNTMVVAAGADSRIIGKLLGLGFGSGILSVSLPITRRRRYMFYFHSPQNPGLNSPLTMGPDFHFRRDGVLGNYITAVSLSPEEASAINDKKDAEKYFYENIRPNLAKRVPCFEKATLKNVWAGYHEHNTFDSAGILGRHPLLENVILACGFNSTGIQHAPVIGRAVSELFLSDRFLTMDLNRFTFLRIPKEKLLVEESLV